MNHSKAPNPDEQIDQALRAFPARLELSDTFNQEVWRRIRTAEDVLRAGGFASRVNAFLAVLLRPVFATAAVLLASMGGLWLGTQAERTWVGGKTEYVRAISPFARDAGDTHP